MPSRTHLFPVSVTLAVFVLCSAAGTASAQAHFEGAIGPGSMYEIDVPASWNGDLVLYAHGIVEPSQPVAPPTTQDGYDALRSHLLGNGFAVAASSYSSNGWSLADAVHRTQQLNGIAVSKIGQPGHTFLVGHSMGALAVVKLAETYPTQFDGVLAMCGPLGGAVEEIQYAADARVAFDYYFPGVLPGTTFDVPPGTVYLSPFDPGGPSALFMSVYLALAANPSATAQWASAAKLPYADGAELGNSALYMVGFLLRYTNDLIARVNGQIPYDNSQVEYRVNVSALPGVNDFLSAQLNAGVTRFEADPAAINYYDHNYKPTGQVDIPVITLHTTRDPAIPFGHESRFAAAVANAGQTEWLVQRPIDRWGHCAFQPSEVESAFADLVAWVNSGVHP